MNATTERDIRLRGLLRRVAAKDQEALGDLYDATVQVLYCNAIRIVKNAADAEEIVFDVLQQVWRTAHQFDPSRGTVMAWLLLLTRSRSIDRFRHMAKRRDVDGHPLDEDRVLLFANEPAPDEATIFRERERLLREALRTLPPEQRQALELAYQEGLSHSEIAAGLALPLGTVKSRVRMAKQSLRVTIGACADAYAC